MYNEGNIFIDAINFNIIQEQKKTIMIRKAMKKYMIINPGPEVIELFSCSTQLSPKFIWLINVKIPTIVGINIYQHDKYNI